MQKDNIRDYAIEAFRYYARCGKVTAEEIKKRIYDEIYAQSSREQYSRGTTSVYSDSTAYAILQAEQKVSDLKAEIEDILAVEKTIAQVDKEVLDVIELVYFADPDKAIGKGEISNRVHKAEIKIYASERSIYMWLKKARLIFARERGLRYKD